MEQQLSILVLLKVVGSLWKSEIVLRKLHLKYLNTLTPMLRIKWKGHVLHILNSEYRSQ